MTHEEALQVTTDSEEECTFSSEEEEDFDDELLHFEERFDAAEDTVSNECDNDREQMPAAKRARTLSWKAETDVDGAPQTLRFLPAREPGPQLSTADANSPMSLFKLFFTDSAVDNLCQNTNAQAARAAAKGRKYKWTDVSVDELYRYIGLVFYMAAVKMSSIADYWRRTAFSLCLFRHSYVKGQISHHFMECTHESPRRRRGKRQKEGTAQHDRLFRIKPLMNTIRLACKAFYHPRRNLAVNERLVACRAKREVTPCMKAKLTKFKFFILSDSSNGYTVDFSVYTGKNSFPTDRGLSYDAVMSLLDRKVLGSGYHVYMDDFYTSPKLFTDLFALKFGACGTYRDQRKDFKTAANSLSRNCRRIHQESVQRKFKAQHTWKAKSFPCPAPVTAYNQHMGGVDLSDQLLQYYAAQHKTMKWYRKIFLHFLDIAANNAFILHKELLGSMTHDQFMEELIAELCGLSQKAAPKQFSTDHVPVPGAQLTSDVRRIATVGRRICVHCKAVYGKKQQTPWKCQACDVHLCLQLNRNCFQEWHKSL
ncbi:piggyBac transposable element-derived protein 4-like [Onychostoma macrolepis]|uniref:piggyBac transposable element-derived protein 4-like n=1 Tax=Onychostoma macrolepis TaxID=369639 RepID=UPI00272AF71F|nr:piggyBac transposable element-derived protein 4-like [Onychostoma macrolepis]